MMAACCLRVQCVEGGAGRRAGWVHGLEDHCEAKYIVRVMLAVFACPSEKHLRPKGGLVGTLADPSALHIGQRFGVSLSSSPELQSLAKHLREPELA